MINKLALLTGKPSVDIPWPKWPIINDEDLTSVSDVLMKSKLSILDREGIVKEFEEDFAAKFNSSYALSFSSGTAAIHSACFACGSGPGFEVLTPSYTWMSAITAILHGNGTPVFCDLKKDCFFIDPEEIVRKASLRTKAVIVCHAWGIPAPMDEIMDAARSKGILVIEDASHAPGAKIGGEYVGTIGDIGCFSLQASKPLAAGEGGVLTTNDRSLYERAMITGHHDVRLSSELTQTELLPFKESGAYWKYRATPLDLALGKSQLKKFDETVRNKRDNFLMLCQQIEGLPFLDFPSIGPNIEPGYYCCPSIYKFDPNLVNRETFLKALWAEGATVFSGYNRNWYQEPILQDMNLFRQFWVNRFENGTEYYPLKYGELPNTDEIVSKGITFPTWGEPVPDLIEQYVRAFHKINEQIDDLIEYQQKHTNK